MSNLKELRNELEAALSEQETRLSDANFDVKEFTTYHLADVFVKMRNFYETAPNDRRSLAVSEKVRTDVVLSRLNHVVNLDEHSKELTVDLAKANLAACLEEANEYFVSKTKKPDYAHYADGESVFHMPKYDYIREAQAVLLDLFNAVADFNLVSDGELEVSELADIDSVCDYIFEALFDGKDIKFNPNKEIALINTIKEKI